MSDPRTADSLRDAQLRQEYRSEIMRGYQAALCNSDVPGWTLGDEVAKVADNLLAAHPAAPALDKDAVRSLLQEWRVGPAARPDATLSERTNYRRRLTNALLELARPMPTREALDNLFETHGVFETTFISTERVESSRRILADAVLALVNGDAAEASQNGRREVSGGAVEEHAALRCKHCGDEIKDTDDGPWRSAGEFGGTGTGAYAERFWCADAPDHEHSPDYGAIAAPTDEGER